MKKKFTNRGSNTEPLAYHAGPQSLQPPGRLAMKKIFRYINCYTKFEALFLGTGGLWGPMAWAWYEFRALLYHMKPHPELHFPVRKFRLLDIIQNQQTQQIHLLHVCRYLFLDGYSLNVLYIDTYMTEFKKKLTG